MFIHKKLYLLQIIYTDRGGEIGYDTIPEDLGATGNGLASLDDDGVGILPCISSLLTSIHH